jgi:hypothetical protein
MNTKKLQLKKKQLKNLSLDSLVLPQNKIVNVVGAHRANPGGGLLGWTKTGTKIND